MLVDELRNLSKETKRINNGSLNLPLARLDALRVEVTALEVRKPGLGCGRSIAVGRTEHDLHLQVVDAGASLGTSVVRGAIHEHNYLSAPVLAEL